MTSITSAWHEVCENYPKLAEKRNRLIKNIAIKTMILELIIMGLVIAAYFVEKEHFLPLLVVGLAGGLILPWVIVKPQRLMKRKYLGQVRSIQYIQRRISVDGGPSRMMTSMVDATFICCTVMDSKGKRYTFELPEKYAAVYHEGDLILSMSGFNFPLNMSKHDLSVCPCCGGIEPRANGGCRSCH